jgi:hypothetical protein
MAGLRRPGGAFGQLEYPTPPFQFTRAADQRAAAVIPSQLDGLRKKERLRELYQQQMPPSSADELAVLASVIGPQAGLDEHTALACLTEFVSTD